MFIISTRAALSVKDKTQLFAMVGPQICTGREIKNKKKKKPLVKFDFQRQCHAIGKGP